MRLPIGIAEIGIADGVSAVQHHPVAYMAYPAVLHLLLLIALLLDHQMRVHLLHSSEALCLDHFKINSNAAPLVIQHLIRRILVNQRNTGKTQENIIAQCRLCFCNLYLFHSADQNGLEMRRK